MGGISDLYIENTGPERNAVSVGLFRDRARAEIRAGRVRRLDVVPQISDRYRTGTVWRVHFQLPPGLPLDAERFSTDPERVLRLEDGPCLD